MVEKQRCIHTRC